MSAPVFEIGYRGKLWRVGMSEYEGRKRLSVWSHYQDLETGHWKPCGGRRDSPGFFVEADRADELAATLAALAEQLRSNVTAAA